METVARREALDRDHADVTYRVASGAERDAYTRGYVDGRWAASDPDPEHEWALRPDVGNGDGLPEGYCWGVWQCRCGAVESGSDDPPEVICERMIAHMSTSSL
jgi:hypothetical protein